MSVFTCLNQHYDRLVGPSTDQQGIVQLGGIMSNQTVYTVISLCPFISEHYMKMAKPITLFRDMTDLLNMQIFAEDLTFQDACKFRVNNCRMSGCAKF